MPVTADPVANILVGTMITRYRCTNNRCLLPRTALINLRPNGHGDFIASGPCPKCGAGFHCVYGEYGPADLNNLYAEVGIRVTKMPNVRCTARCANATSVDCKCSCGGARHGIMEDIRR